MSLCPLLNTCTNQEYYFSLKGNKVLFLMPGYTIKFLLKSKCWNVMKYDKVRLWEILAVVISVWTIHKNATPASDVQRSSVITLPALYHWVIQFVERSQTRIDANVTDFFVQTGKQVSQMRYGSHRDRIHAKSVLIQLELITVRPSKTKSSYRRHQSFRNRNEKS